MCPDTHDESRDETKTVGGPIPVDLYWSFKRTQAERKESATQALENAIRLYVDLITATEVKHG